MQFIIINDSTIDIEISNAINVKVSVLYRNDLQNTRES